MWISLESFSTNVKKMSHVVRVENLSPLQRAARLVEHVSQTRDSHIFGHDVEFRIRQKWILTLPVAVFVIVHLMRVLVRMKTKVD